MKKFSIDDVRTLKNFNKEKLDFYINYLKKYKNVEEVPLKEACEWERKVARNSNKKAEFYYRFPEDLFDIFYVFGNCPYLEKPEGYAVENIHKILAEGSNLDAITPSIIYFYITDVSIDHYYYQSFIFEDVEKGYFLTLLKILKKQLQQYLKNPQYYEKKYGAENLLTLDEDCENGRKAGSMAVATNPDWEEDWKEFIKHDMQWDPKFLELLIVHKLKLMRKYYDPDTGGTCLIRRSAKRNCRQIDKALELAAVLEDDEWTAKATKDIKDRSKRFTVQDRLYKQATRRFFLYLANHYNRWWD